MVGRGRIGSLLYALAREAGRGVVALGRADLPGTLAEPAPGRPILVCTRNDDLEGLLPLVHPANRADLVFVQNGMLIPWLEARGLGGCTQGLLYVAVPRVGATPRPGGTSVFWGPHAGSVVALLQGGGIAARVEAEAAEYRRASACKFAWNAIFGLLGEATGAAVGRLAEEEAAAVRALSAELAPVLAAALGVALDGAAMAEAALAYSREIPDYPATLKEWRWRNGWLVEEAARQGRALPAHEAWLARAKRSVHG